jgi:hypothetical protein
MENNGKIYDIIGGISIGFGLSLITSHLEDIKVKEESIIGKLINIKFKGGYNNGNKKKRKSKEE